MTGQTDQPAHWTVSSKGASNSSVAFVELCDAIERIIRNDAHTLINGRAHDTARLIMAQLAHRHGLEPGATAEARGFRKAVEAIRAEASEHWAMGTTIEDSQERHASRVLSNLAARLDS